MQTQYPSEPGGTELPATGMPEAANTVEQWALRPMPAPQAASAPAAQQAEPLPVVRAAGRAAPIAQGGAGAATVLIVDDSRTIRHLYTFVLQAAGYTVLAATDGVEGLETALRTPPGLLLVDMLMPRMDGLEMLRALRAAERERGISEPPALLLTALAAPPTIEPELGVLAVLDKGHLTPGDMAEEVRMFFSARAQA